MDEITAGLAAWKPGVTEFVVFTKTDWERIRAAMPDAGKGGDALDGIELMPLELDAFTD
jgi:hypothetical protein